MSEVCEKANCLFVGSGLCGENPEGGDCPLLDIDVKDLKDIDKKFGIKWTATCCECGGVMEYMEASMTYFCSCGNILEV